MPISELMQMDNLQMYRSAKQADRLSIIFLHLFAKLVLKYLGEWLCQNKSETILD